MSSYNPDDANSDKEQTKKNNNRAPATVIYDKNVASPSSSPYTWTVATFSDLWCIKWRVTKNKKKDTPQYKKHIPDVKQPRNSTAITSLNASAINKPNR